MAQCEHSKKPTVIIESAEDAFQTHQKVMQIDEKRKRGIISSIEACARMDEVLSSRKNITTLGASQHN